jgi:hypothetical protein
MPLLELPSTATAILAQLNDFPRENAKLPVYALPGIAQLEDIEDLCQTATKTFLTGEGEGEDPTITFLAPAPATRLSPGTTVQEILDAHVVSFLTRPSTGDAGDDDSVFNPRAQESKVHFFPFAFVVIEDAAWRRNGVTVVFCHDEDDVSDAENPLTGWRVDECEVSLPALVGVCRDLVLDREEWSTIEVYVGRPTRRTGSGRYLAERSGAWNLEGISSSMPVWGV